MNSLIGKTILHYKIIQQVGQGGMGVVYLAEDTRLERKVAIKFLPRHIAADKQARRRFEIEAKAAAALNHPNIATIYAIEESDDDVFIVMEYIEGQELRELLIVNRQLSIENVLNFTTQIAEGLQAAHKKGIVHRDIKSTNIMLSKDGLVKIMDFGLAKMRGGEQVTKPGLTVGTVAYMSPEQARGEEVDQRTDIWSFGVLLYEMLTGEVPFKGDYDQVILYSILNEEPQEINTINLSVPENLSQTVMNCLKKSEEERYGSFEEVLSDLGKMKETSTHKTRDPVVPKIRFVGYPAAPEKDLFVGRESQLKLLRKKFNEVLKGNGTTVFIQGESGIGKTQLISHAVTNFLPPGINTIWGRCLFQEGGLPYHPFVSGIKNSIQPVDDFFISALSHHARKYGISLSTRIPYLKSFLNLSAESVACLNKEQLWDSILVLLQVLAGEQPLVLILDDLQWADKTTLGLFSYITRNITHLPILQIGIYRKDSVFSEETIDEVSLTDTVRQLKIEGIADQLNLLRLTKQETEKLTFRLFDDLAVEPRLLKKIVKHSEGQPLFVSEMVHLLKVKKHVRWDRNMWRLKVDREAEIVSQRVQDIILQRLDRLASEQREILEIASCQGEYFYSDTLEVCLKMDRITLLKHLQSLENEHHLIRYEKSRYRFDHLMVRQVLYGTIFPELRQEYHYMIAQWLRDRYSSKEEFASRIAYHLIASGREQDSLSYLLKAANRARDLHAIEEALVTYQKLQKILAGTSPDDVTLHCAVEEGLGDVFFLMGKFQEANTHYGKFLTLTRRTAKAVDEIEALRKLAENNRIIGNIDQAMELSSQAMALAAEINHEGKRLNCLNTMAYIYAGRGGYGETIELSNQAAALARTLNDLKNQSIALSNLGFAYWHMGNYQPAMEQFNEALKIQESIGDKLGLSTTLNFLGLVYWKLGYYEKAFDSSFESVRIKKQIAHYRAIPGSLNVIGDIYRDMFMLEKAVNYHTQSLKLARQHNNKGAMCDNLRDLGSDHLLMGDFQTALRYFEETLELAKAAGIMWYETKSYISLGELYLLLGENKKAQKYADLGLKYAERLTAKELRIEALWTRARVKAKKTPPGESEKLFKAAIDQALEVRHNTLLWQLFLDYSKFLEIQGRFDEMKETRGESKKVLQIIAGHFKNSDLKKDFLESPRVKEVLEG